MQFNKKYKSANPLLVALTEVKQYNYLKVVFRLSLM